MLNPSLTSSRHESYRQRLALLAGENVLVPVIDRVGEQRTWWNAGREWACTFGRFFPDAALYATLLFVAPPAANTKQALCVVNVYDQKPRTQNGHTEVIEDERLGWLSLTRFPADAKLPSIGAVMAEAENPKVVRYRPGKRCTIRFDGNLKNKLDNEGGQLGLFAKLFRDHRGRRLHDEATALWQASERGEVEVAVPRSLRWDVTTGALWQTQLAGMPVHPELFGPNGAALAERMGRAAASLAVSSLRPQTTFDRQDQWQETFKQGEEICSRVPWLAGPLRQLMRELARLHAAVPQRPLRPIHGAPHAPQWLYDGERLGLVDFDGFTLGDPELDIATFMSEIDYEKPSEVTTVALNVAFLAGYEAVVGSVDPRLLQAYCAHKRLSKALKYAYAIHPEGDIRAEQAVGRALICALGDLEGMECEGTELERVVDGGLMQRELLR